MNKKPINIKVTFENRDTITTLINTDIEGAKQYYLNNIFNLGTVEDELTRAIKVEQIF